MPQEQRTSMYQELLRPPAPQGNGQDGWLGIRAAGAAGRRRGAWVDCCATTIATRRDAALLFNHTGTRPNGGVGQGCNTRSTPLRHLQITLFFADPGTSIDLPGSIEPELRIPERRRVVGPDLQ